MNLSKRERRKLRQQNINPESVQQSAPVIHAEPKKNRLKYYLYGLGIPILLAVAYSAYSVIQPGPYDSFAKCLTEKGAVVYGAIDWCHFTQAQKAMFGSSWKYLDYRDFTKLQGIKKTPTWVIKGVWYENVQSFDKLSSITGCKIN